MRTLYDFDDRYTAARNGFASADDYYARCNLLKSIARIEIPGLIVHAMDDPFIPCEPFLQVERPENVTLELIAARRTPGICQPRPLARRPSLARGPSGNVAKSAVGDLSKG